MGTKPDNPKIGQIEVSPKRVFTRGENDPPNPIFLNNIEFGALAMDVYMDVGLVVPESVQMAIANRAAESDPAVVDFNVLFRFGLSVQTAAEMHQRLGNVLRGLDVNRQQAALNKEEQENKS